MTELEYIELGKNRELEIAKKLAMQDELNKKTETCKKRLTAIAALWEDAKFMAVTNPKISKHMQAFETVFSTLESIYLDKLKKYKSSVKENSIEINEQVDFFDTIDKTKK